MSRRRRRPGASEAAAVRPARGAVALRAAILAAAVLAAYSNALSSPFILDDQGAIVENAQIRELWRLDAVFAPPADSSVAGRPLVNLSLALNYAAGQLHVVGYHIWNLAVHLACAILAFAVILRTMRVANAGAVPDVDLDAASAGAHLRLAPVQSVIALALAAALLWAVHPLNSEVVNYVVQRTESMMAACLLATLYAAARALSSARPARWQAMAVVACALGMLCKETMVVAPVLVALWDRVYAFDSWRAAARRRWPLYAGLAATWVLLAVLVAAGPRAAVGGFSSGVAVWTYLLNQTVVISHYVQVAVWPSRLVVFYGWPAPMTLADVWPHALFIAALLAVTAAALVRAPRLGFLGAWFFITLAPSSSVIPIATEVGAERRMYLPLLAITTLAALAIGALARRLARVTSPRAGGVAATVVVSGIAVAFIAATLVRNEEYRSPITLAQTVVDRRPTGIAHHILAEQLVHAGRNDDAIPHLRAALEQGDSKAGYALGLALAARGDWSASVAPLQTFIATAGRRLVPRWLEPSVVEVVGARLTLGDALLRLRDADAAAAQARAILDVAPRHVEARGLLGAALFARGDYRGAIEHYRQYASARPAESGAWVNLGLALVGDGRLDDAVEAFRRGVSANPRDALARRMLAMSLYDSGRAAEAVPHAREAVALNPADAGNRELLERALAAARR